ncbi:hypothetical protein J6590_087233 [Homalodisca vitripennis]|nr:hypothetical protein J6590_087233 [Homalodisca vitripennis]
MAPRHAAQLALCALLVAHLCLGESHIQRISQRQDVITRRYFSPKVYPCMEDWNKICRTDADCCSGSCLALFCEIVGLEKLASEKLRRRKKMGAIGINKNSRQTYKPKINKSN